MSQGVSLVVIGKGSFGEGPVIDNSPVHGGSRCVVHRERGIAERFIRAIIGETDGVYIERGSTTPPKSDLHVLVLRVISSDFVKPVRVVRSDDLHQFKTEASLGKVPVQDMDLGFDLFISKTDFQDEKERPDEIRRDLRDIPLRDISTSADNIEEDWDHEFVNDAGEWGSALVSGNKGSGDRFVLRDGPGGKFAAARGTGGPRRETT